MKKAAASANPEPPDGNTAQTRGLFRGLTRRLTRRFNRRFSDRFQAIAERRLSRPLAAGIPSQPPNGGTLVDRLASGNMRDLNQEQALALAVLNTVDSLVIVLDREGRCVRGNPACERVTGCSQQQMQGQFFWEIFRISAEAAKVKPWFDSLVAQRATVTREISFMNVDGQLNWFTWSINFILDDHGEVAFIVGTGIDLTERKQRERQQEAFTELVSALRGELSVEQIYETVLESLRRFLPAELVCASVLQQNNEMLLIQKALGAESANLLGKSLSVKVAGPAEALGALKPCVRPAVTGEIPYLSAQQAAALHSVVWAPLVIEGAPAAILMIASRNSIGPSALEGAASMIDMAASAINRRLLLDETQRQLRRLTALSTINIAVSSSLDIQVTLRILVNQITAQLGVDAADILLVEPVTRDLHCAADHGFRSSDVSKTRLWMGQGYAGQIAMQHKSIHLFQPEGISALFLPERRLYADEFVAYHAVPLTIKGEVKGVLETFHRMPYQPDAEWPQFLESLAAETSIAINNAELLEKLQRNNLALEMAYDSTIEGWALALEMRDRMTEDHTRRVAEQTLRLAQALGIRGDDLKYIRYGALLHDIGKIGIPDSILNKTGPLDEQEWEKMRRHPDYARQMLASIPFLSPAMAIPCSHHERWNGSGYPQKLSGLQIPLPARIFAVVDVWDALSSGRVYRSAMPEEEVLCYLESEAGRLFDPQAVAAFVELRRLSAASERRTAGQPSA